MSKSTANPLQIAECRSELKEIERDARLSLLIDIRRCYARDLREVEKEMAQLKREENAEINAALRDKAQWEARLAKAVAKKGK